MTETVISGDLLVTGNLKVNDHIIGDVLIDLTPYMKTADYEADKEGLVSDSELTTTLADYTSKELLTETVSDRPTFTYVDSTFAKLGAANTFTGTNAFNGTITVNEILSNSAKESAARLLNPNGGKYIYLGQSISKGNAIALCYRHEGSNNVNNNFQIYFQEYGGVYTFYRDRVEFARPLKITEANGLQTVLTRDLNNNEYNRMYVGDKTTLANFALGKENNTYYAYMKINSAKANCRIFSNYIALDGEYVQINGSQTNGAVLFAMVPELASGRFCSIVFGRDKSKNNSASFNYCNKSTPTIGFGFYSNDDILTIDTNKKVYINSTDAVPLSAYSSNTSSYITLGQNASANNALNIHYRKETTPYMGLGFNGNDDILTIDTNKNAVMNGTLTATGDITAPNITAINETLTNKANTSHTHTLSDITDISYQTTSDLKPHIRKAVFENNINRASICYGNGTFIVIPGVSSDEENATSNQLNKFMYSTDGGNAWSASTFPTETQIYFGGAAYGNGRFCVFGLDDTGGEGKVFTALENEIDSTWTAVTMPEYEFRSACYGDGKFVAISINTEDREGIIVPGIVVRSTDGSTWESMTLPSDGTPDEYLTRRWYDICYGNGKFVAIDAVNHLAAYSTDAENWATTKISGYDINNNEHIFSICYGNGVFVVVGDNNKVAYSSDGINWNLSTINSGENLRWFDVCFGCGQFIACSGKANTMARSINGIDWSIISIPEATDSGSCYVCPGDDRVICIYNYSNDCIILEYENHVEFHPWTSLDADALNFSNLGPSARKTIIDLIYPVGIYVFMDNNPASSFAVGTWESVDSEQHKWHRTA